MNRIVASLAVSLPLFVMKPGVPAMAAGIDPSPSAATALNTHLPLALVILGFLLILRSRVFSRAPAERRARSGSIRTAAPLLPKVAAPAPAPPPPVVASPAARRPLVMRSPPTAPKRPPTAALARGDAGDATVVDSFAAIRSMLLAPPDDDRGPAAVASPARLDQSDATVVDSYASMRARLQIG